MEIIQTISTLYDQWTPFAYCTTKKKSNKTRIENPCRFVAIGKMHTTVIHQLNTEMKKENLLKRKMIGTQTAVFFGESDAVQWSVLSVTKRKRSRLGLIAL